MESNEEVIEASPEKRRSNSAETGGILLPVHLEQIPITTRVPEPSPNDPLQQFYPVSYPIPDPPSQDAFQFWPYGPPVPPVGQQGEFPNWPRGQFLTASAWPGTYPQIHQPQEYSAPLDIYGSNEVGASRNLVTAPPGQVDLTLCVPFL